MNTIDEFFLRETKVSQRSVLRAFIPYCDRNGRTFLKFSRRNTDEVATLFSLSVYILRSNVTD
jgi:hypothetical protein